MSAQPGPEAKAARLSRPRPAPTPGSLPPTSASCRLLTGDSWGRREPGRGRRRRPRRVPRAERARPGVGGRAGGGRGVPRPSPSVPAALGRMTQQPKQRQRQEEEAAGGREGGRGGTDRLGGRVVGGEDWGKGGAGGGGGHHLTPPPSPPTGLEGAEEEAGPPRLGERRVGPGGRGNPLSPFLRPEIRPWGTRESPLPAARLRPGPPPHATSVSCPTPHGHSKSRPRPQFTAPPSIHPSRCPHHALLPRAPRPPLAVSPSPALPVASRAPPTALLRTRVPSCARHLGGLSPSFTGRRPSAVGARESAGVRAASRGRPAPCFQGWRRRRGRGPEAVTPPRASQWAASGQSTSRSNGKAGKGREERASSLGARASPASGLWGPVPICRHPPKERSSLGLGWPAEGCKLPITSDQGGGVDS